MLERESRIHIHPFKPIRSKTVRLQTVAPLFEARRIHFVEGAWTDATIKEITAFPFVPHDDKTDAIVWGATYFAFYMNGIAGNAVELMRAGSNRSADRKALVKDFTETKVGKRELFTHAERSWFFGDGLGATSGGRQGRSDLRHDVGMD